MLVDRTKLLLDTIKRLLRRSATSHLHKIVNKTHAADLAVVFRFLTLSEQETLFDLMDSVEQKAMLFSELEEEILVKLIEDMPVEKIAEILEQMPSDDVADLLGKLSDDRAKALLELMTKEGSKEVEGLLEYDAETAGGIMVPDFIALKENTTAREAIEALQKEYVDVEMPFYLYVLNDHDHLVGVISLRQLVVVPPETRLKSIMATDVVSVQTNMDQEEVARVVARYNILAVPVVDENNKLVGIVTVDDVIDIIREEATEDILKMAGIGGGEYVETQSIFKSIKKRLPWLFASWIGGIFACYVVGHFQQSLSKLVYLAAFMPIIMGMGGNVGTQTSTSVVRGLATGRINVKQIWHVILRELSIGFSLGFFYGLLLSLFAQFRYGYEHWQLGLVVGFAMICSMTVAATVASCLPLVFHRFHIDPAVATGPFVTTSTDILSVFFYFQIATLLLHI
ncbi:MAG: magnesium transporter [Deltaproteobacteria bacterium]|nr:magnesium transporter [Deltaproteobacteria bacterium]MBW2019726.1 magnesium transporter [Deltaproteobacteria bacterium]MBW2073927.1 magnesium transporter [Deltaproteobacteria bacterium]